MKLTYNEMVIEALYAMNDMTGVGILPIRKYMEVEFDQNPQKASFQNLTKKAIDTNVAAGKIEKVGVNKYVLATHERQRIRDEELAMNEPPSLPSKSDKSKKEKAPKVKLHRGSGTRRFESREETESPQIRESNTTLRQQKIIQDNKRDNYLKDNHYDALSPFLPEKGNYFEKKEKGLIGTNFGEDSKKYPFPVFTDYEDFDKNKKARAAVASSPFVEFTKCTVPTKVSDFSSEDIKPTIINPMEAFYVFKSTGVVNFNVAKRGPNMLNIGGQPYAPKTLYLDGVVNNPNPKPTTSSSDRKPMQKSKAIEVLTAADDNKFGRQQGTDIDYGLKVHRDGTTDFGFDKNEIVKPTSAFHIFNKTIQESIKEELIASGKNSSLGVVMSVVSARWNNLTPEERSEYDDLAKKDKERYDRECADRDADILRRQEEKRAQNQLILHDGSGEEYNRRGDLKTKYLPREMKREDKTPPLKLLSDDAKSINVIIDGTGGLFDGYQVIWPGRRLPDGITYSNIKNIVTAANGESSSSSNTSSSASSNNSVNKEASSVRTDFVSLGSWYNSSPVTEPKTPPATTVSDVPPAPDTITSPDLDILLSPSPPVTTVPLSTSVASASTTDPAFAPNLALSAPAATPVEPPNVTHASSSAPDSAAQAPAFTHIEPPTIAPVLAPVLDGFATEASAHSQSVGFAPASVTTSALVPPSDAFVAPATDFNTIAAPNPAASAFTTSPTPASTATPHSFQTAQFPAQLASVSMSASSTAPVPTEVSVAAPTLAPFANIAMSETMDLFDLPAPLPPVPPEASSFATQNMFPSVAQPATTLFPMVPNSDPIHTNNAHIQEIPSQAPDAKAKTVKVVVPPKPTCPIDWRHVYYLERVSAMPKNKKKKRVVDEEKNQEKQDQDGKMDVESKDDSNTDKLENDAMNVDVVPHIKAEKSDNDSDDGYESKEDDNDDTDLFEEERKPHYLCALREANGTFIPLPKILFKWVFPYATRKCIPISNMVELFYIDPHTNEYCTVKREYCDKELYKDYVCKIIRDTMKKFPETRSFGEDFFENLKKVEEPIAPKPSSSTDNIVKSEMNEDNATNMEVDDAKKDETCGVPNEDLSSLTTEANIEGVELIKQPKQLTATLHEHQIHGISWMVSMFEKGMSMILGDQMGLGKTIQSIGFISYLKYTRKQTGPYLVVMPLSVLSNWMAEFEKFCPQLKVIRFHGPKNERNRIKAEEINDLDNFDVLLTTYEMLVSESNFFKRRFVWASVIVDEGHRLKNEKSQLSDKLKSVPTICRVILTGTPLQNNLRELWALLHFLQPDIFTSSTAEKFEEGFDLARGRIDQGILRKARQLLSVFMLRRLKENINIKLPSKKEVTIVVPLTDVQKEWYKRLLLGLDESTIETVMSANTDGMSSSTSRDSIANGGDNDEKDTKKQRVASNTDLTAVVASSSTSESKPGESDWRKLMNLLLQLRKVCNHVMLMQDASMELGDTYNNIVEGSGKLKMLDRMLPRLKADGNRVLIFSQFTSMLNILEEYCDSRNHTYVRLDGETNRVQRRLDVRRYNAPNSPIFVFLISTRAGGLGLNLATSDTVILYDSDWNPQVDLQAMERSHRIGQTKAVRVYRLICSGSVEERMINRAGKKLFLNAMVAEKINRDEESAGDDAVINESSENDAAAAVGIGGASISKNEVASLIRFGANAVVQNADESEISDNRLDRLLERRDGKYGRDTYEDEEELEMKSTDVMENIMKEEVDLRQLGSTKYEKNKITSSKERKAKASELGIDHTLVEEGMHASEMGADLGKRVSKSRIIMVDGSGSGYGGAVPILAQNQDSAIPLEACIEVTKKGRDWKHCGYCLLCGTGMSIRPDQQGNFLQPCGHCPRTFHIECLRERGLWNTGKGSFICSHHKCSSCNRNTAAAGGLLFRCTGCMTSYCEDCLPQDEIEGLGRYKPFEELGYISKQAYYVKCPACIADDAGEDIDEGTLLSTQQMPVYLSEQEDEEDQVYLLRLEKEKKEEKKSPGKTSKATEKATKGTPKTGKKVGRPKKNPDGDLPPAKKAKKK